MSIEDRRFRTIRQFDAGTFAGRARTTNPVYLRPKRAVPQVQPDPPGTCTSVFSTNSDATWNYDSFSWVTPFSLDCGDCDAYATLFQVANYDNIVFQPGDWTIGLTVPFVATDASIPAFVLINPLDTTVATIALAEGPTGLYTGAGGFTVPESETWEGVLAPTGTTGGTITVAGPGESGGTVITVEGPCAPSCYRVFRLLQSWKRDSDGAVEFFELRLEGAGGANAGVEGGGTAEDDAVRLNPGNWTVRVALDLVNQSGAGSPVFEWTDVYGDPPLGSFALDDLVSGEGVVTVPPGETYYGRPNWDLPGPSGQITLWDGSTITVEGPCE